MELLREKTKKKILWENAKLTTLKQNELLKVKNVDLYTLAHTTTENVLIITPRICHGGKQEDRLGWAKLRACLHGIVHYFVHLDLFTPLQNWYWRSGEAHGRGVNRYRIYPKTLYKYRQDRKA